MELPDRLRETLSDVERDDDDLLPPAQSGGAGVFMNMNQSIFGLIAAAGSRVDFNNRFEGQSSDEEEGDEEEGAEADDERSPGTTMAGAGVAQTTVLRKPSGSKDRFHRRKISESKLLRSLPTLSRLSSKTKSKSAAKGKRLEPQIREESEPESTGVESPLDSPVTSAETRLAPVMSRMLEARAEMSSRPSFDLERLSGEKARTSGSETDTGPTDLAKRLMEIFQFDVPEEVISEYPCWLLQSVLLQGYIYITAKHICFYAYLPKKSHEVAKSGYLSKCGKRNPKYNRYWFRLKGDVLSYYTDPSSLYFPHGQIDLRYGISASITDKDKEGLHFSVVTDHRTYHFRADSAASAKEWVKSLQRVIFRSHNDGDSVKISLPIQNVIDIEETQMLEFADTCKIRVIDNDETYAIDEYFFSFFSDGKDALNILKILIEDASSQQAGADKLAVPPAREDASNSDVPSSKKSSMSGSRDRLAPPKIRTSKLSDSVKATLSPMSPQSSSGPSPRASGEYRRTSFDAIRQFGRKSLDVSRVTRPDSPRRSFSDTRRSLSRNRLSEKPGEKQESSDSYVQSMEDPSLASMSGVVASASEGDQSASQILRGSDVFHSPTIRRSESASASRDREYAAVGPSSKPTTPSGLPNYSTRHAATTGHVADPGAGEQGDLLVPTTPTLQNLTKMGSYPLQRAGAFADYLNRQSKRMSTLLATESMGYVEKVSGMWKGGQKHYDEPAGLRTDDELGDEGDDERDKSALANERFRAHFALPDSEKLTATYFGYMIRVLPLYGKIYISDRSFCFRSLLPGTRTKLILPLKDIENVDKEKGFRFGYAGLVIVIRGHEELFFEFGQAYLRDDCAVTLLQNLDAARFLKDSGLLGREEKESADNAMAERDALQEARREEFPHNEVKMPQQASGVADAPTILFDDPKASFLNFKPDQSLRITCLTIGSRGDVQPYIALCKGLLAEGHKPRIATHPEFQGWIESHGIEFARVEGDPGELMRLCIQNGTFTVSFYREASSKMRHWLDDLLASSWTACQNSDVLIESPSAMAGIHIAEKLQIPYFRAFTMPWTRTRAYPHAFVTPESKSGGAWNYVTYVLFDNFFWKATAGQINRWRNKTLGLPNTNLERMAPNKVPFLYNFSRYVVPPPLDYSDWIRVTGYWFLDEGATKAWEPPRELTEFIDRARKDDKKLVYVGFGSIIIEDSRRFTQEIIDAVLKADVRCVLSKGWSDRLDPKNGGPGLPAAAPDSGHDPVFPPEIHVIKSAPHDWLFAQMDAAAHHGGSGTTGASLRAGIPTIIKPFFGDQFFFGNRVEDLGVGICMYRKWSANGFARALWEATHSERMIVKARVLGEQIRKENGVDNAIQCIYRDMEYAKSLVVKKASKNAVAAAAAAASPHDSDEGLEADLDDEEDEESWTFVGGEGDYFDGGASKALAAAAAADADALAAAGGMTPILGRKALGSRVLGGIKSRS
ncbi:Sterol 3-beta-glucosyltransferase [Pleurostoma richardsiae]|uniref:Sterol 3-beta-glucosyltransferase n=1 Tax=Pleurostoma richardsiae TaxID=41990 RepID=A0AA38VIS0_9PEZI|nr:Sterol 3-beta-glucosyltransferase [Pleurostoma richardsiae]